MHPARARLAALWAAPVVALGVVGPWIDAREFGMSRLYYGYDGVAGLWALAAALAGVLMLRFLRESDVRARLAAGAFALAAVPAVLVLLGLRLIPVDDIGGVFDASWRPAWGLFMTLAATVAGAALAWRSRLLVADESADESPLAASVVTLSPGR